jgi:uncharacterized protein
LVVERAAKFTPFTDASQSAVRGFLHQPATPSGDGMVLTHGAGSNCDTPLLIALAAAFAEAGFVVLRCDLPFRQKRPHGPPFPGGAKDDRAGLRNAVNALRRLSPGAPLRRMFLGGHSYGGRQATMLAAEEPHLIDGLLLLSYPLHPPRQPSQLRITHFPALRTPALFVHGTRDPFGSLEEMRTGLNLIAARTTLLPVEGAGHDLSRGRETVRGMHGGAKAADEIVDAFRAFFDRQPA